jgi:hypothetical protein
MSSLAEILRPQKLEDIVGQSHAKKAIQSWIDKDQFPRCQLYTGPVGTGKSSLAAIVARACQGPGGFEGADIRSINAGAVGKVDDMRELAAESASRPFFGRYRVFILEEFQRATDQAADAILVPMENNLTTVWILTSSDPSKILPAIKSRCSAATFELKPLNRGEIADLVLRAAPSVASGTGVGIGDFLSGKGITSPREILGVLDQHLAGLPLEECIHGSEHEPLYSAVASAVLSGNWTKTAGLLAQIPTADYRGMVAMVSAYLKSALLKEPLGARADALGACLVGLGAAAFQDGVAYASATALFYKCCRALNK